MKKQKQQHGNDPADSDSGNKACTCPLCRKDAGHDPEAVRQDELLQESIRRALKPSVVSDEGPKAFPPKETRKPLRDHKGDVYVCIGCYEASATDWFTDREGYRTPYCRDCYELAEDEREYAND